MGLLDRWRRKRVPEGESTGSVFPVRGGDEATRMVDPDRFETQPGKPWAPERATAQPVFIRHAEAKPAPAAAGGLAPTRVESALPAPRPCVVGVVVAVEGEFEGRAFPLFEGSNRLGREEACEICLPSEQVAPQHACIEYRSGFFRLEHIGEVEVRVNFEPSTGALLRDGDILQLGMTTLRFRSIVGG